MKIDMSRAGIAMSGLPGLNGAVERHMLTVLQSLKSEVQATIKRKKLQGPTGRLLSEITVEPPRARGKALEGGVYAGSSSNPLPYAAVMEYGRRPGGKMPPVKALKLWIERKEGMARKTGGVTKSGNQRKPRKGSNADRAQWSLAWAVAKSIAKKGIKGRYYWRETLARHGDRLNRMLQGLVAQEIRLQFKGKGQA